jgi:hypothetical protein
VAAVARDLGVGWATIMRAVADDGTPLKAVGMQRPGRGRDLTPVTPVDLSLGAREDLKAPVEAGRLGVGVGQAGPVLPDIEP